jgi:lactate racemase
MTQIDLAYGRRSLALAFDDKQFQVLTKSGSKAAPLNDIQVGAAFDSPINAPPLDEFLKAGNSVLIVVSDATRATASAQVVNLLVRRIIQAGVAPSDIAVIFATGIHRPVTQSEKSELLSPFIAQRIRTIDHNADDTNNLISLGHTRNGIPVEVNRALKDFTHIIITGGISFHYFAGFTGGRKSICPGLASTRTIELTHMLALDFEKGGRRHGVGTGMLEGNAVHQECDEIASVVEPSFGINTVVDELGRATGLFAGHWREAHLLGCEKYLSEHSVPIAEKRALVIVSCGGYPFDINLIQAHKALEMASYAWWDNYLDRGMSGWPGPIGFPKMV